MPTCFVKKTDPLWFQRGTRRKLYEAIHLGGPSQNYLFLRNIFLAGKLRSALYRGSIDRNPYHG